MDNMWDCIIVGGGAAGLSAPLVLGRARRRTLVVDAGAQSNLAAYGIGGLLGHDGRNPAELASDNDDLSAQMPQVAAAIASGSHAAAAVVHSLMADEYGLAVPEGRRRVDA